MARTWWVYYRIKKDYIEVQSVKHILQQVRTFHDLEAISRRLHFTVDAESALSDTGTHSDLF